MQIVIDIPDRIYKRQGYLNIIDSDILRNALKNGTPLPKGHGRLIDEEQIPGDSGWDFSDRLMLTPTIIEADKESEVEK